MNDNHIVEARLACDAAERELVAQIRYARAQGLSLRAIADAAGVSHETVRQILRG
jgi:DNA-binding CsgD family transcriptional regulator